MNPEGEPQALHCASTGSGPRPDLGDERAETMYRPTVPWKKKKRGSAQHNNNQIIQRLRPSYSEIELILLVCD